MNREEIELIKNATHFFEDPGTFTKILGFSGDLTEKGMKMLPETAQSAIQKASKVAIEKCLWAAVATLGSQKDESREPAQSFSKSHKQSHIHTAASAVTGAISGFVGPEALLIELPVSTSIIMRSIASTATEFGFDLSKSENLLECLFVFTIGGPSESDDGMNSSYIEGKLAFSAALRAASESIAGIPAKTLLNMVENGTAPAIVRLIAAVADTFGIRVTKKLLAQSAPIVGALGGAGINFAFANYFGAAARHHFALKRLAVTHGNEAVDKIYQEERRSILAKLDNNSKAS